MAEALMAHILPSNATAFDRTLAAQVENLLDLDIDAIRSLWNPWTIPLELLPYLAWSASVDIWRDDWTETKKRSVVANSMRLHRLKGTEQGMAEYLDLVDCKLLRTIAPPARAYAMGGMTEAERLRWLEDLPQIRLYPFRTRRTAPRKRAFYGMTGKRTSFYGYSFGQATAGPRLSGKKATLYNKGVETPVNYEVLYDPASNSYPEIVSLTAYRKNRSFYGHGFYGHGHMLESRASENIISLQVDPAALNQFSVFSGARVQSVSPVRTYQGRIAPKGKGFWGAVRRQKFYTESDAPSLIFDRVSILDPTVLAPRKKTRFFYGYARYGQPKFTAEVLVDVPMVRPSWRANKFWGYGFAQPANMQKLHDALEAIHVSKRLRDNILVDTEVYRTIEFRDEPTLGTFKLDEMRKVI